MENRKRVILNVYSLKEKEKWNEIVKSFDNWDVYYLYEYAYSFMLHGDGEPLLIEYQDECSHFCYVVMKSDISKCSRFEGKLEIGKYYDLETPYGYGGPLCDEKIVEESQEKFLQEMTSYCKNNNIVSQFIRFHPLLENQNALSIAFEIRYLRDTIYIDTISPEIVMANMDSKSRNMVRKAMQNEVTIERRPIVDYKEFLLMYEETMRKAKADKYYIFREDYYKSLEELSDNACIFYAKHEGKAVAGSIIFYNDKFVHYHLAGSLTEFRKKVPGNLLLYEVACWASERGIKQFHLGGGMSEDDSLFGFKKQFNKNGRKPFAVGRTIFDYEAYGRLLKLRKQIDSEFDMGNDRMIQYRY